MKVKHLDILGRSSIYYSLSVRILLNLVLAVAIAALAICVYKSGEDLYHAISKPLETILQQMLLDLVFIVALVEIINTIVSYLRDGEVHVRYIVDTILIIMLNEVVSAWFLHEDFERMGALALIIGTLAAVRVSVTKFAPKRAKKSN